MAVELVVHGAIIKMEVAAVSEAAVEVDWDTTVLTLFVGAMGVMGDSVEVVVAQPVALIVPEGGRPR